MLDWLPTSPGLPLVGLPPDAPTLDASCRPCHAAAQQASLSSVLDVVPSILLHFVAKLVDADAVKTPFTCHLDCLMAFSPWLARNPILCLRFQFIYKHCPASTSYSLAWDVLHGSFGFPQADLRDHHAAVASHQGPALSDHHATPASHQDHAMLGSHLELFAHA